MTLSQNQLELLSPCRTADIGMAAIDHGADTVYIGGPQFSARANAGNSISEIEKLARYAHRFKARVLMALNTIMTDQELEEARNLAHQAWNAGVDALIIQDMGLLMCDLPPIELHASTQCDIRTVEKAKFLEDVGFTQIVPARELCIEEIRTMHNALERARIEFFIHGALCVSYSGQCYASQVLKGRSANRGECAHICRLPFDVYGQDGRRLKQRCYALSLHDNNQSENLSELIEAGVRSFKIEGRLKDAVYVKNVTAHYRRLIDSYIEQHPEFERSSRGRIEFKFEPDIANAFNRGSTDYFVHGRPNNLVNFDTPKKSGNIVGKVKHIEERSILVESKFDFSNGDGLTFISDTGELNGFLVNRAEQVDGTDNRWILHLRDKTSTVDGLKVGLVLMRNKDSTWIKKMSGQTAFRKIPIKIKAAVKGNEIKVQAEDKYGAKAEVSASGEFAPAKNPQMSLNALRGSLSKLGETDFVCGSVEISEDTVRFFPVSFINELRRRLTVELAKKISSTTEKTERIQKASAPYPQKALDYHGNVLNAKAREFYAQHGVEITEPALEDKKKSGEIEVMKCKYCLRYALGLCPKEAIKQGEKIQPTPLTLVTGGTKLEARFNCKACEMSIFFKN